MISPLNSADFTVLYRFAVALAGVNEEAEQLVHEVLEEKLSRLAESERHLLVVKLLHALWQIKPEPRGDAPISNLPPQFQWMKTRDRAVVTLRGFGQFSDEEIVAICGPGEIDETVLMPPEKISNTLESIAVSPELLKRLAVTVQGASPPFRLLSPLGVCLIFAGLVLCGTAGWLWRGSRAAADQALARKFIDSVEKIAPSKLEPIDAKIGELADTLYLKYGLENYPIPTAFATLPASRLAVGHVDGHPVVQIGLKDSQAFLMLFRAEDFGLEPDETDWQTASIDGWSLAVRSQNQQGHVLTLHGSDEELRALLPK